ncbi:chitinase [Streptomyces malaysiensis subsp. malaysiensis]|uniref:chitinase n=1 Tax=Streptomyces malaysiensis TaxID=92644 RepID=UPI000BFB269F|nr:chitinase [Streptomyces malaysiensis]ATL81273.1 chitinase A [Streptomyces malaysiensis]QDL74233.1 chitinase [Streptomyces malaysiensis]
MNHREDFSVQDRVHRRRRRRIALALAVVAAAASTTAAAWADSSGPSGRDGAEASAAPAAVAPYLYNGWGDPPDPGEVMDATGVSWFTLAFVLDAGGCDPQWDGGRPLTGGQDEQTVKAVRAKGGDVVPSFGGASGAKLEQSCGDAKALAGAYQKVIDAYGLKAIDIDIEGDAYDDPAVQQKTIDALKQVKGDNPGLLTYVTFPSGQNGPDDGMIRRAAESDFEADSWTIMPFDFGGEGQNMGELTKQATDGLKDAVKGAYGYSDEDAYRHSGLSSMNGITDVKETVSTDDFETILDYASQHHLSRLSFWSVNRDRPCPGDYPNDDTCSGVAQEPWQFTGIFARYQG